MCAFTSASNFSVTFTLPCPSRIETRSSGTPDNSAGRRSNFFTTVRPLSCHDCRKRRVARAATPSSASQVACATCRRRSLTREHVSSRGPLAPLPTRRCSITWSAAPVTSSSAITSKRVVIGCLRAELVAKHALEGAARHRLNLAWRVQMAARPFRWAEDRGHMNEQRPPAVCWPSTLWKFGDLWSTEPQQSRPAQDRLAALLRLLPFRHSTVSV
jgi:hypothetical protein